MENLATNPCQLVYVPEQDGGLSAKGRTILSADMWIPLERFTNPEAIIRMSTIMSKPNARNAQPVEIKLARMERHHLVLARHLHDDWSRRVPEWETVDLSGTWERVGFNDRIRFRNEEQEKAWAELDRANKGILNLACGKGKTVLSLKKIASRDYPAVVIVNNEGLISQWAERAKEHLGLTDEEIGVVQGTRAQWDRPLVIAMIHTLANRADQIPLEVRMRFGTVVFDEVHHLSAATFFLTANMFFGVRIGVTATAEREDGLEAAYYAHVGNIFHKDLQGDLDAEIIFHSTPFSLPANSREYLDRTGEFSCGKLYTYLAGLDDRNHMILEMVEGALEAGRKILVLTHSKEHPEALKRMFEARNGDRWTAGAVSGATDGPDRTGIIQRSNVSFATFQVAREALDVAVLDTVVFVTPFKAWGAFQQGKGRVERYVFGKPAPMAVILDDVRIGPAHAMCRSLRTAIRAHGMEYDETR